MIDRLLIVLDGQAQMRLWLSYFIFHFYPSPSRSSSAHHFARAHPLTCMQRLARHDSHHWHRKDYSFTRGRHRCEDQFVQIEH
ncbi:hypothetical protein MES4922_60123 [Mesorhizobium ventifaucium]|uniref:Secreted protein n=1 Tax=Mesorhizobium ventifaucium TaxID=666020 RepID=A0ABM9ECW9_9HYPH|nr:hypothetical protein MES4922_60123 [Mesorhizobium ventifaucium]